MQGDAEDHYRQILHRYDVGARIGEPDATQLFWLLERRPKSDSKIGAGVDHFSVRKAIYGQQCFEVVRFDGTKTDFSFKACITGRPPSALSEALSAMRAEVVEDTKQLKWGLFRDSKEADGKVPCALSGRLLSLDEAIVDHAPPKTFKSIAMSFLADRKIDPTAGFVDSSKDNQYVPRLTDKSVAADWRAYYRSSAVVRVIEGSAHLGRGLRSKQASARRKKILANVCKKFKFEW